MIDHRTHFDGHKGDHLPAKLFLMINHLTTKLIQKSDLPVKPFPMIDHLTVKLIQMSDHLTTKTMSIDELSPTGPEAYFVAHLASKTREKHRLTYRP